MTAALDLYRYADQDVRVVTIDGDPWFVAADVCAVLGIANNRDALTALDDDEKGVATTDTLGGAQSVSIISEPGLYSLILRSRKPEAKAFKRWVTHDVIPAIRRTGTYAIPTQRLPQTYAEALRALADQAEHTERVQADLEQAAPKAEAWDTLATAIGDYAVADAAKILARDPRLTLGRNRLFTVLTSHGWLYRQLDDGRLHVKQHAVDAGWLSELPSSHYHPRTGELVLDAPQVRVTVRGLQRLHQLLTTGDRAALPAPT